MSRQSRGSAVPKEWAGQRPPGWSPWLRSMLAVLAALSRLSVLPAAMSAMSGAACRGEFEERLKSVIKEVQDSQGQIVLFIDEIHNIVGAGARCAALRCPVLC